jgi:ParB/RepB/Spo0J family partition protein
MATKAAAKKPAPAPTPELTMLPGGSMPLIELMTGLEEHAAVLGPSPERYTRPAGWPSRLSVPTSYVVPGRWQPRSVFVDSEISDLADSIRMTGIVNPLIVFVSESAKLELIAGERRLRAAGMVGLSLVPVEVIEGTPAQLHELSLVDNIQRANLRPWEEGAAFERMIVEQQISEAELARRMGKNRAYIQQRRALAAAAPAVIDALGSEQISQSMARGILAGAGDMHAAQSAAVANVIGQLGKGRPVNESAAKKIGSDARVRVCIDQARVLGWSVLEHYSGRIYIWGGAQRPQVIDPGSDLVTAIVVKQSRPAGDPPAAWEPDEDLIAIMRMRGYTPSHATHFAPWLAFSAGGNPPQYRIVSGAEMPAAARQAQADIDGQEERARAIGWEPRREGSTLFFVKGDERTESCYTWDGVEAMITTLAAGGKMRLAARARCRVCGEHTDTGASMWHGTARIHVGCKDGAIEQERQQILASSDSAAGDTGQPSDPNAPIPGWIQAIPHNSVRALVWMLTEGMHGGPEESLAECYQHMLVLVKQAEEDFGEYEEETTA